MSSWIQYTLGYLTAKFNQLNHIGFRKKIVYIKELKLSFKYISDFFDRFCPCSPFLLLYHLNTTFTQQVYMFTLRLNNLGIKYFMSNFNV